MIVEIRNKISSSGSNLTDRLEDQLTGNVFGALRYLSSELGLRRAISKARASGFGGKMAAIFTTHPGLPNKLQILAYPCRRRD